MHKKTNYWLVEKQLIKHQLCYSCESICRLGKALYSVQSIPDDHDCPHTVAFECNILAMMGDVESTMTVILLGLLPTKLDSVVDKNPSNMKVIVCSIPTITV